MAGKNAPKSEKKNETSRRDVQAARGQQGGARSATGKGQTGKRKTK